MPLHIFPYDLTIVAGFIGAVGAAVTGLVTFLTFRRDRINRSGYDQQHHIATLSMLRAAYEDRIADLTQRLTATEQRWAEVNHLLLDGHQGRTPDSNAAIIMAQTAKNPFLESLGIDADEIVVDPKLIFVLTPFSKRESGIYSIVREVCHRVGLHAIRGDEKYIGGPILPRVVSEIMRSGLVIGVITTRNPNVFYELGVAQALGKPTILVSRGDEKSAPIDVRARRVIFFENVNDLEILLQTELARWIVDQNTNPETTTSRTRSKRRRPLSDTSRASPTKRS